MLTNVAKAGAAKQSVGQGMQKHIAVRVGQYFWRVRNAHAAKTHGAALTVTVNIVAHARADRRKGIFVLQQVQIFRTGNLHVGSLALYDAYLKAKGLDEDTTAVELMSYFRTRYEIANSYTAEEMRKIASVRYAVNVRYEINTNSYIFVEDASIDLISDLMGVVGNVVEVETASTTRSMPRTSWAMSRP